MLAGGGKERRDKRKKNQKTKNKKTKRAKRDSNHYYGCITNNNNLEHYHKFGAVGEQILSLILLINKHKFFNIFRFLL